MLSGLLELTSPFEHDDWLSCVRSSKRVGRVQRWEYAILVVSDSHWEADTAGGGQSGTFDRKLGSEPVLNGGLLNREKTAFRRDTLRLGTPWSKHVRCPLRAHGRRSQRVAASTGLLGARDRPGSGLITPAVRDS